jgi:hypothetical protein
LHPRQGHSSAFPTFSGELLLIASGGDGKSWAACSSGRHCGLPEVDFFSANWAEIEYGQAILVQYDGETALLDAKGFPLVMELTEPAIRTIEPA